MEELRGGCALTTTVLRNKARRGTAGKGGAYLISRTDFEDRTSIDKMSLSLLPSILLDGYSAVFLPLAKKAYKMTLF
jgi:hypothetical protein